MSHNARLLHIQSDFLRQRINGIDSISSTGLPRPAVETIPSGRKILRRTYPQMQEEEAIQGIEGAVRQSASGISQSLGIEEA
jgi:hypothetical protein